MILDQLKFLNNVNKIKIYDNVFSQKICNDVLDSIEKYPFYRTETDGPGLPKTGLSHNLYPDENLYELFFRTLVKKNILDVKKYKPYRVHLNLFLKNENCFFHVDSECEQDITFIYYASKTDEINYTGNTDFILNNKIVSIPYVQNRMISFPANFTHRATSFHNKDRFSLALKIKYEKK
jgi:hypothetical protein